MVALVGGYLIGASIWFSLHPVDPVCAQCEICIEDSLERTFVSAEEIETMLRNTQLYPVNQPCSQISTQAIEQCVQKHPMIRQAQCYVTSRGIVRINMTQRIPLLKVEMEGNPYYVDTDRLRMPVRSTITTSVLPVRGRVEERMARGVIGDVAEYVQHKPYWETRFVSVYVKGPQAIELVDTMGVHILLGDGKEYIQKLGKLQTFEQRMRGQDYQYSVIDLRFQNQVIGRP